jgi:Tol biopolymer transport system component
MHFEAQVLTLRFRPAVLVIAGVLAAAIAAAGTRPTLIPLSPSTSFNAEDRTGIGSPALSPDGSRLAFLHRFNPTGANPRALTQLFVMPTDTFLVVQATSSDSVSDPAGPVFSHDGTVVYFTAVVAGTTCREVCRVNAAGGDFRRLTFQNSARGLDPILAVAPIDTGDACFCTASDLLDESLDLARDVRNIYQVGPDGTLRRLSNPLTHPLVRAEILGGSMDDSLAAWVAADPELPHGRPLRPWVLHLADGSVATPTPDVGATAIKGVLAADGSRLILATAAEYTGGPSGSQLFRMTPAGDNLERLTYVTSPGALAPAIDGTGARAAFETTASILMGEVTGRSRVYTLTATTDLVRLSSGWGAAIAADGSRIAYLDDADSLGANGDGSPEIFSVRPNRTDRRQHTHFVPGVSDQPRISTDGGRVVFASTADLDGGNPDGSREICLVGSDGQGLRRLTSSAAPRGCRDPAVGAGGLFVVFCSNDDLVSGGNSDHNYEVFRINADGGGLVQITATTSGQNYTPRVSADGGTVAFVSTANIAAGATMGSGRVAVWNAATAHLRLATGSSDQGIESFLMNDAGTRIALLTAGNIESRNPTHVRRPFTVSLPGDTLRTPAFPGAIVEGGLGMSPEGNWLALAGSAGGGRIVRIPFGGGAGDTLFSSAEVTPTRPTLSSGGGSAAFVSLYGTGSYNSGEYYLVRSGSSSAEPLIGASQTITSQPPSLSGDGHRVAFVSARSDSLNPDGSTEVFLAVFSTTAVALLEFEAGRTPDGAVRIAWRAEADADHLCFFVERADRRDGSYREISGAVRSASDRFEYLDPEAPADAAPWYRLVAMDRRGGVERFGPVEAPLYRPTTVRLQAYPNPTRERCRVAFTLPAAGPARVRVLDVAGRLVARLFDGPAPPGRTEVTWDGRDFRGTKVANGVYLVRLNDGPAVRVTMAR